MQLLPQRTTKRPAQDPRQRNLFADAAPRRLFWQARFYDFNVWTTKKRVENVKVNEGWGKSLFRDRTA
jgi:hypothetical protein